MNATCKRTQLPFVSSLAHLPLLPHSHTYNNQMENVSLLICGPLDMQLNKLQNNTIIQPKLLNDNSMDNCQTSRVFFFFGSFHFILKLNSVY